jgi:hypothetical protein
VRGTTGHRRQDPPTITGNSAAGYALPVILLSVMMDISPNTHN